MQNKTLGKICMFGQRCPITYNNEAVQIGCRLGKTLKHSKIYAIDNDTILNMEVMNNPISSLKEAVHALHTDINNHIMI